MAIQTPLMVVTDAGLAVASQATPTGPYIYIRRFRVGSAFGYEPDRGDTGLNGAVLYEGTPLSYRYVGNNTINILCRLPPEAGPFDFGEVALDVYDSQNNPVMFSKAVFDTPQTKYSSLGSNVASTYTFNCLLKLQQSVAVFKIDALQHPDVWEVDYWHDVYPAAQMANPDIPLILVRELSDLGETSLLEKSATGDWTLGTGYNRYRGSRANNNVTFPVAAASTTWVEIPANLLHPSDLTNINRRAVIKTSTGFFRSVSSVIQSGSNYRFILNGNPLATAPVVGSRVTIYRNDIALGYVHYDQIIDPPTIDVGPGLYKDGQGRISARGLLHGPGVSGSGRVLTGSDNLNDLSLPSGIHIVNSGAGYPANLPVNWDGTLQIMHVNDSFQERMQIYIPSGTGTGDSTGKNGYPMYWRSYVNTGGYWAPWYPIMSPGKRGPGMEGGRTILTSKDYTFTATGTGLLHVFTVDETSNNTSQITVNGNLVSSNTKGGSRGYGRRHHDTAVFYAGDVVRFWCTTVAAGTLVITYFD